MTRLGTVGRPTARLRDKGRCSLGAAGGRVRAQPQAVPVHPPPPAPCRGPAHGQHTHRTSPFPAQPCPRRPPHAAQKGTTDTLRTSSVALRPPAFAFLSGC